ncbi:serine protease [Cerasicoccus maritimus]|uniref:serine protease n=1 Tax=Cerasicoccus maritimus TaxID=490089 RepID=UPI0028526F6B|nr:serine protease [Cerasicoccus maritimus]
MRQILPFIACASLAFVAQAADSWEDLEITIKIIGGGDAKDGEYPWMVGVMDRTEPDNYYAQFCGGVLIHPYYILTAAHCAEGETTSSMNVLVGTDDLDSGGRRVNISQIIIHPQYDNVELDYDIALLRLATPVTDIEPIDICDQEDWQLEGTLARIVGWGQFTLDETYPSFLQEGDVTIRNFGQANEDWFNTLTDRMMPAVGSGGTPDSCSGDSGGPLLVRRPTDNAWVIAGITSFGHECAVESPPAIYTRVFRLRDYIYGYIYPDFTTYAAGYNQFALGADTDGDSFNLLEEYGFNMSPNSGQLDGLPDAGTIEIDSETYATITFNRRRNMDDFAFNLLQAPTPSGPWETLSLGANTLSTTTLDANTESITARASNPISEAAYLRLELTPTGNL